MKWAMDHSFDSDENRPTTLRNHMVHILQGQILSGKYRPGDRLNESKIAREFQVSRIPVREALSRLQEQGLVINQERRGMFVVKLSLEEIQQINSVRLVLETEAMHLARARMTPEILAELTQVVEEMEAWDGSPLQAACLNHKFHATIWRASGNPYLERMLLALTMPLFAHKALDQASQQIRRWRLNHLRLSYSEPERFSSLATESTMPPPGSTEARPNRIFSLIPDTSS